MELRLLLIVELAADPVSPGRSLRCSKGILELGMRPIQEAPGKQAGHDLRKWVETFRSTPSKAPRQKWK